MTPSRALAPRMRPLALVVVALVTLLLATLLMPATPADAAGQGSGNSDQGPPVVNGGYELPGPTTGDNPPGSGGGDPNVVCFEGNMGVWIDGHFRVRVNNHPKCIGGPGATDTWKFCTAGFQVFRFYGTETNPARSATVSMMNKDRYCNAGDAEEQRGFGFWSTSGYDNQNTLGGGNYNSENTDAERGVKYKAESADAVRMKEPMFKSVWSTVNMTAAKTSYIGSGRPYFKMGGPSCADVRTTNGAGDHPIKAFMNDPDTTPAARQWVFDRFARAYEGMKRQIGIQSAKKELGIDEISGGQIIWDTTGRCASPIEYTSTSNAEDRTNPIFDPAKNKVTGVCYIPVIRKGRLLGNGQYSFNTLRINGGLRYSDFYTGQAGTNGNFLRSDNKTTATPGVNWEVAVVQGWRERIADWYKGQATGGDGTPEVYRYLNQDGPSDDQTLPAGPYRDAMQTGNVQQVFYGEAQAALLNASKCRFGSRFAAVKNKTTTPNPPPMVGTVTLNDKYVLHAGGARPNSENVQEFSLSVDATCNAYDAATQEKCQDSKPQITGAGATVDVSMPAGYTICDPRSPGAVTDGCDFSIVDYDCEQFATPGATAPNACRFRIEGPANNTKFKLVFYGPTEGADKVKIALSDVDVSYTYLVNTGTYMLFDSAWYDFGADQGDWGREDDTINVVAVAAKFTPSVGGAPVPLNHEGGGRFAYEAPVIGAVAGAVSGDVSVP